MTEEQKRACIASLMERAKAADRRGLFATAKSWRDHAYELSMRPAREVVLGRDIASFSSIDASTTP